MNSKKLITVSVSSILVLIVLLYGVFAGNVKTKTPEIVVFGDSLIGNDRTETSVTSLLSEYTGMEVFNGGIGGSLLTDQDRKEKNWNCYNMVNMAQSIANNDYSEMLANIPYDYVKYNVLVEYLPETIKGISKIRFSKVKYIVLEQGINDCMADVSEDVFEEALRSVISDMQTAAPKAKLIVVSPGYTRVADEGNHFTEKYVELERRICSELNISFVDFYNNSGIYADNYEDYLYDGLHTNAAGNEILAKMIKSEIN